MQSFKSFLEEEISYSGIYTYFKPTEESKEIIQEFVQKLRIPNELDMEHYHCTVIYSKDPFDIEKYNEVHTEFIVNPNNTQLGLLGTEDEKCLVLLLNDTNTIMHKQWSYGKSLGLNYTWPKYQPHITLSYNCPNDVCDILFGHDTMKLPYEMRREIINTPKPNKLIGKKTGFGPFNENNTIKYPIKLVGEFKEKLEHDKF